MRKNLTKKKLVSELRNVRKNITKNKKTRKINIKSTISSTKHALDAITVIQKHITASALKNNTSIEISSIAISVDTAKEKIKDIYNNLNDSDIVEQIKAQQQYINSLNERIIYLQDVLGTIKNEELKNTKVTTEENAGEPTAAEKKYSAAAKMFYGFAPEDPHTSTNVAPRIMSKMLSRQKKAAKMLISNNKKNYEEDIIINPVLLNERLDKYRTNQII